MARFCTYCGRPLADGEVCSCRQQNAAGPDPVNGYSQGAYGQGSYGQGQPGGAQGSYQPGQNYGNGGSYGYNPQNPRQPGSAGEYARGILGTILNVFKTPAETLRYLATTAHGAVIWGILGIQTLLYALVFLFVGIRVNGAFGGYYKLLNTPLMFFLAIVVGIGNLAAFAGIALLFGKGMGKKPMTYNQALGVAAGKALAQMPFTLLTILAVLIFIEADFGLYLVFGLYALGWILGYVFTPYSMEPHSPSDANRKIWMLFLLFLVTFVVTAIIGRIYIQVVGENMVDMLTGGLF